MKVYAVRDIAGYKKGDEVQVFHAKEIDGETWFMIWSKNLKMWGFYKPNNLLRTRFGWRMTMENEPWYKKCIRCKNLMFGICMADVTIKQFAENGSICPLWEEKTMEYKSPCKDCKWHDVF